MDQTKATKEANERTREFVDAVNSLRANSSWSAFRRIRVEMMIRDYELIALKPANTQNEWMACERAKGAAIALRALLVPFDSTLPEVKDEEDATV